MQDSTSTTNVKTVFLSTWNTSTKLQRVVFLTKLIILFSQVLVWVSLLLCAISLVLTYKVTITFSILLWRWQKRKLQEEIDANCLNVDCRQLEKLPKPMFDSKIEKLKGKTTGRLVKEYPTASARRTFRSIVRTSN